MSTVELGAQVVLSFQFGLNGDVANSADPNSKVRLSQTLTDF